MLLSTVGTLVGIKTLWRDQARPSGPNPAWVLLRIRPVQGSGVDSTVYPYDKAYDPSSPDYVPANGTEKELAEAICEVREITLSCYCESLSQADDKTAWGYLETLRTGLASLAARAALAAVNVATIRALPIVDLTGLIDQRDRSIANLDIRMRVASVTVASRLTFIETVEPTEDLSP